MYYPGTFIIGNYSLQYLGVIEAFTKENDLRNEGGVWYDHGYGSEHWLQIVWQLSTTSVACGDLKGMDSEYFLTCERHQ